MIKHVNSRNVRVSTNFKIRSHPSATTEDLIDYVKLIASKKPTIMVIHTKTNDPLNAWIASRMWKKRNRASAKLISTSKFSLFFLLLLIEKITTLQLALLATQNWIPQALTGVECIWTKRLPVCYAKTLLYVLRLFKNLIRRCFIEMIFWIYLLSVIKNN